MDKAMLLLCLATILLADLFTATKGDGYIIKCVDIKEQLGVEVSYDLLKKHKIQERPSDIPKMAEVIKNSRWPTSEAYVETSKCPKGTIPKRQAESRTGNNKPYIHEASSIHEHAIGGTKTPAKIYGTRATINVWRPYVEEAYEFSLSQIWITAGSYETNDLNSIEVGWQVSQDLYKDTTPRLFIYWTGDTYNQTGCYNLDCPGFIQISNDIIIGGVVTPVSVFKGNQFEITISVWMDRVSGNWWLSLGSNHTLVGYWPGELFTNLAYGEDVQWGGEIVDSRSRGGRHTRTQMGSGQFPDESFGKASYFRNLAVVYNNNTFQPAQNVELRATNSKFYNITKEYRQDWGTFLFYGGPEERSGVASEASSFLFLLFCFHFLIYHLV